MNAQISRNMNNFYALLICSFNYISYNPNFLFRLNHSYTPKYAFLRISMSYRCDLSYTNEKRTETAAWSEFSLFSELNIVQIVPISL